MAREKERQEEMQRKQFRSQLAVCVRSIQWSYAIFWSMSSRQEGLLEWNDGYYNGDIKTRKITQPTESKADQMGLQRSEQLRELYKSLCTADSKRQNKTTLSPEDLTDAEWYYMICMSFTFSSGQDLPGEVYKRNGHIWLNNTQLAENRSFCRSLLAKSASIQTVVCLPFMDGVLELGTSDMVLEDPRFMQNITSAFWESQAPACSEHSTTSPPLLPKEESNVSTIPHHEVENVMMLENHALNTDSGSHTFSSAVNCYAPKKETGRIHGNASEHHPNIYEEITGTPGDSFNNLDDSLGINKLKEASQVHRRHLMDGEFSHHRHGSLNSSECLSWSFAHHILTSPKGERIKSGMLDHLEEDNHSKLGSFGFQGDGSHYSNTISAILGQSKQKISPASFPLQNDSNKSSFKAWKEGSKTLKIITEAPQRILKKILTDFKWRNGSRVVNPQEENVSWNKASKTEVDDTNTNHMLSERRRREKLNDKFLILRSLVPSISKVDKASILADTIEYVKELEKRVEELESSREEAESGTRERRMYPDTAERTSDNYHNNGIINCQPSTKKRKASEIDGAEAERPGFSSKNRDVDISVNMIEKEGLIQMQCPWRDHLLLDIIEAMSHLRLDAHTVLSTTVDGTLAITVRAKFMSTLVPTPGMIKSALQRVVGKCQA